MILFKKLLIFFKLDAILSDEIYTLIWADKKYNIDGAFMVRITIDTGDDRPKTVTRKCAFCGGSGRRPAAPLNPCPVCGGRRENKFYVPPKPTLCGICNGSGRELGYTLQPCPNCRGTGYL